MTRPVILLDIDGVINAVAKRGDQSVWPAEAWATGHAQAANSVWPILWARPVVEFLTEVHESGRAEIRWHTTWQQHAASVGALVGLPKFPVADPAAIPSPPPRHHRDASGSRWWKWPAAVRVVDTEARPLIWLDDDLFRGTLRDQDAVQSLTDDGRVLAIAPRTNIGLTPAHLRRVDSFIEHYVGGAV